MAFCWAVEAAVARKQEYKRSHHVIGVLRGAPVFVDVVAVCFSGVLLDTAVGSQSEHL